jgi:hypothetical protein
MGKQTNLFMKKWSSHDSNYAIGMLDDEHSLWRTLSVEATESGPHVQIKGPYIILKSGERSIKNCRGGGGGGWPNRVEPWKGRPRACVGPGCRSLVQAEPKERGAL